MEYKLFEDDKAYECKCCGAEVSRSAERDRGKWCFRCFPPARSLGFVFGADKRCYGDCRERYKED